MLPRRPQAAQFVPHFYPLSTIIDPHWTVLPATESPLSVQILCRVLFRSLGDRNMCHSLHLPSECTWNSDNKQKNPQQNSLPTTCQEKSKPVVNNFKEFTGTSLTFTHQIPCWELLAWLEVSVFLPSVQCCISDDNLRIICPQLADSGDGQFSISSTHPHNNGLLKGVTAWGLFGYRRTSPLRDKVFAQEYSHPSTTCCKLFNLQKKEHVAFVTFNLDRRPRSLLQSCLNTTEQLMA